MFKYESIVTVDIDDDSAHGYCVCLIKDSKIITKEYYSSKEVAEEVSQNWTAKNYSELATRFHC